MRKRRLTVLLISISMIVSSCATTEEDNITESTIINTEMAVSEAATDVNSSESSEETTASETSEEVISVETALPSQYAEILDAVYDYTVNYAGEPKPDLSGFDYIGYGISEVAMNDVDTALGTLCYSLMDLDGNGVDELLIMDNTIERYMIIGMYTIENNEAVQIIDGWSRNTYYLLPDKTIFHRGSSGAAYTVWGYYEFNDGSLDVIEMYYTTDVVNGERVDGTYVYRNTTGDLDSFDPSSTDEFMGTTQDIPIPDIPELYEFDDVTLLADYS